MVADPGKQRGTVFLVQDKPDVAVHPRGPEMRILGPVDAVHLQARVVGVHLRVEGRGLGGFLFLTGKLGERVGKGVGDAEGHSSSCISSRQHTH